MKLQKAINIYNAGPDVVVEKLRDMSAEISRLKRMGRSKDKEIARLTKESKSKDMKIARLSKNSTNSSKKPSSDDVTKAKPKKKGGKKRKIGGQPGHPMHERPLFPKEDINYFHDHKLDVCPVCGDEGLFIGLEPRIIQQVDIKEIVFETHENCAYPIWCETCQEVHYAPFPPEIVNESFFKARITATVAYMNKVCHASFSTIRKFFRVS